VALAPESLWAPKSPMNVASAFFNTVHLLPKNLKCQAPIILTLVRPEAAPAFGRVKRLSLGPK